MKKYTPTYKKVEMGGGMTSIQVFMTDVPKWLEGFGEEYVKAELAEEMLGVLKEAHNAISTINAIQPLRYYVLEEKLQSIIAKAEEV